MKLNIELNLMSRAFNQLVYENLARYLENYSHLGKMINTLRTIRIKIKFIKIPKFN